MSADNGIYILEDEGKFKVFHCQAVDNLYYSEESEADFRADIVDPAPAFDTEEAAMVEALRLYKKHCKIGPVEYGISIL